MSGYSGLSVDNIDVNNKYLYAGYYTNTTAPCVASAQPSCGGQWVALYSCTAEITCADPDPVYTANNLAWMNYFNARAAAVRIPTLCNMAAEDTNNTTASEGADWLAAANACSAIMTEAVPQNGKEADSADKYYSHGEMIDNLFQEALYDAENISARPYLHNAYYADGKDTANGTPAEQIYCMAWSLLVQREATQNYTFCGAVGSANLPVYPASMGGRVAISITGNLTQNSTLVTGLSSTAYLAPGLKVANPNLPPGAYIESVPSSAAFTGSIALASSPVTFTGGISGSTLTVASMPTPSGTIAVGLALTGTSVAPCTTITALGSGTGAAGTYVVTPPQFVSSGTSMTGGSTGTLSVSGTTSGSVATGQTLTVPGSPGCAMVTGGGPSSFTLSPSISAGGGTQMYGASSLTLSAPARASGTAQTLQISGFAPLPIGYPVQPPPGVNPYGTTSFDCGGWTSGGTFTAHGVCTRQYSNGWVYVNPICNLVSGACQVTSTSVTVPTPPGSGSWWDNSCHILASGAHPMAPATALIIAYGPAANKGPCPWAQP